MEVYCDTNYHSESRSLKVGQMSHQTMLSHERISKHYLR